ncbi:MAG TPA: type II toxin-antitoxin system RelE/ParE family toxin [Xanthobacteraceae bacterium]|nr:type II toxin-antitoxin system RelE/ParE family toxin [Xanthobacteraceae bacterium]
MKVRYTESANDENDQLLAGIAAGNPTAAADVAAAIEATVARLGSFPRLGVETDLPGVRLTVARPYTYLIFYAIERDVLVVRNIRHPSRPRPRGRL